NTLKLLGDQYLAREALESIYAKMTDQGPPFYSRTNVILAVYGSTARTPRPSLGRVADRESASRAAVRLRTRGLQRRRRPPDRRRARRSSRRSSCRSGRKRRGLPALRAPPPRTVPRAPRAESVQARGGKPRGAFRGRPARRR